MRTIEQMKNEQLVIVIKLKDKLNIEFKCCIKAHMCRNIYRDMEKVKATRIMGLWQMELIGPVKLMLKGHKGYWDDTIFHTQGGNPTGTGEGGKIYGEPFKDEFRTKLRSCGRGLIAIANAGKDDNTSQFLFTLGCTSELQSKHTIFENSEEVKDSSKTKTAVVKDFNLLSFGEEAEEDEEECVILNKMFSDKGKSARDHLTDPKLSLQPTVELLGVANKKRKEDHSRDWESNDEIKIAMKERIKNKMMDAKKKRKIVENCKIDNVEDDKDIEENK
ncbi:Peptidyl-prolyl cis-trans isomerase CWC27 like protein [Eufriesea mexicana]|uniref:Spliceosome-associated protein CWC27 homolog n=1 Tax=Eufriesea mexicana TaxID=516756 RepID=A0A310S6M0_9HYME|nr:Peptidyl-prolyl cis-trans isomerase CWC27 like protein [Eufriesea mexicana]